MTARPSTDTSQPSVLQLRRDAAVATLTFNRPAALNALDVRMARALLAAARDLASDATVRAVVLRGAGNAFMAGGDLATLRADPVQGAIDLITPFHEAISILTTMNAPVIAQVHGVAAGAGLSLMLHADFVWVAEGTRLNSAFINLGASCDSGTSWMLPRLVGLRRALEIAMLGETFGPVDAERLGLINRVVPAERLDAETHALAQRLACGPTLAYGAMRRLMRESFDRSLPDQLRAEAAAFEACAATRDFRAGVDAFYARQDARFAGH
ncbi:enoyl-CoA hydratase/isomerase family protein [Burkholderia sp. lig30]|jgi:2-(1,2-epoxy-1,2-dihydrophenyl)acetyl-CoA isomerase|uniref:enoyl-CoA hydratase/isomerase family protein n=1 Tax=Burkholderia sp. lig30 TaxID=1192124 RepID=UPI0005729B58|nr:enoyl-CoA hydratase-related protein [Burkholderia sp. lig30]